MATLVCPKCRLRMLPKRQDVAAEQMSSMGGYQVFAADLYSCPECGVEIVAGFGAKPLAHYLDDEYEGAVSMQSRRGYFPFWNGARERDETMGSPIAKHRRIVSAALRRPDEIQAAHDLLVAISSGDVPNPLPVDSTANIRAVIDVLCWVLRHRHNRNFERNLTALDSFFKGFGIDLAGMSAQLAAAPAAQGGARV